MTGDDVRALVRACAKGDPDAWDTFLDRYGRLIWSVALRSGANPTEAEEIFQRTWVAVVEGIGRLEDPETGAELVGKYDQAPGLATF